MARSMTRRKRLAVYTQAGAMCENCGREFQIPEGYTGSHVLRDHYVNDKGERKVIELQVDHVIPLHHGGTNDLENLQALCTRCNNAKGPKLAWDGKRRGVA